MAGHRYFAVFNMTYNLSSSACHLSVKMLTSNSQGQHEASITTLYWFQSELSCMITSKLLLIPTGCGHSEFEAGHIVHRITTFIFSLFSFYFLFLFPNFRLTSTQVTNVVLSSCSQQIPSMHTFF